MIILDYKNKIYLYVIQKRYLELNYIEVLKIKNGW